MWGKVVLLRNGKTRNVNIMYNEESENLIDDALADGELTEKEKQILFKKAQSFGIDLDEFEMVLNARLMKLKKMPNPASTLPHKNKMGDVKKCPACGAMVQSYQSICPVWAIHGKISLCLFLRL